MTVRKISKLISPKNIRPLLYLHSNLKTIYNIIVLSNSSQIWRALFLSQTVHVFSKEDWNVFSQIKNLKSHSIHSLYSPSRGIVITDIDFCIVWHLHLYCLKSTKTGVFFSQCPSAWTLHQWVNRQNNHTVQWVWVNTSGLPLSHAKIAFE